MLLHRLRQQGGTHLAGFGRFNRFSEKNPQMRAVSAAGDLHRAGNIAFTSSLYSHCDVCTPAFFIKINGEETAGFILKQRINAQHSFSTQVRFNDNRVKSAILSMSALRALALWLETYTRLPFVSTGRTVACSPILALPAAGVHVASTLKQRQKESGFFRYWAAFGDNRRGRGL